MLDQKKKKRRVFIAAQFIVAETWKPPKYPSIKQRDNCGIFTQWSEYTHSNKDDRTVAPHDNMSEP